MCATQRQGSIEYAAAKLEEFRQQLELKVVSRFDVAAGKGDFSAMAQCARIMSHFPRGSETLINVSHFFQVHWTQHASPATPLQLSMAS